MLSPDLSATLQRAVADTRRRRHEYLTLEHLLLAMLEDPSAIDVVQKCGGEPEKLRAELEQFLVDNVEALPEDEEPGPDQTWRSSGSSSAPRCTSRAPAGPR
jgi:ATP-dependent Clp protease ATP-binding subunit ClpA